MTNVSTSRPVNLRVDASLVERAKARGLNLSKTLEAALAAELRHLEAADWLTANTPAIEDYNQHVDAHGTFGDRVRTF